MSRVVLGFLAIAALVGSIPAFAVDGVVLINQASVMAAGGFPLQISEPGSYKLSGNLIVPAETNGIVILGSDITLDLNGFRISGPITCQGQICSSHTNDTRGIFYLSTTTTIRNGHIGGFSTGILGEQVSGSIEDIHITNTSAFGIIALNASVRHNEVFRTGGFGLACTECAVLENIVLFNAKGGINLGGGIFGGNIVGSNGGTNVFLGQTVVSQHNNSCNDSGC